MESAVTIGQDTGAAPLFQALCALCLALLASASLHFGWSRRSRCRKLLYNDKEDALIPIEAGTAIDVATSGESAARPQLRAERAKPVVVKATPVPAVAELAKPVEISVKVASAPAVPKALVKAPLPRAEPPQESIPMSEVVKHKSRRSAWIVVEKRVYDCTAFLEDHPGGSSSIVHAAGQDASEDFRAIHSERAWGVLAKYYIGRLGSLRPAAAIVAPASGVAVSDTASGSADVFLDPRKTQQLPLIKKIDVSHDTAIFRFGLPTPGTRLGLPTGMHVFLKACIQGELVARPYTPITDDTRVGYVDFLVKVYFKDRHPKFPQGGKMTQYLNSMRIGECIDCKGPMGDIMYTRGGHFTHQEKELHCSRISLIAGGTGLSPCYQIISAVLRDADDPTSVRLLYANQTPSDILMRQELENLASDHPDRFELWFTVDRVSERIGWGYDVGFINESMIHDHLFPPGKDTVTFMCGPPAMEQYACRPNLKRLGHAEGSIFSF